MPCPKKIMKKCNADNHPYCTYRVESGETVCAGGHIQKIVPDETTDSLSRLPGYAQLTGASPEVAASSALHLHFSGYDPRAAGGRQMIKLELRGTVIESIEHIDVQLRSELIASGMTVQRFERSLSGQWRPLLIAFSSKNKEYGQYQLELELNHLVANSSQRRWTCSTIILVPPPETSLTEIHRVFLGSQKNVKVLADDGSIAKLSGLNGYVHGNMDIEISAKNAALTQVELSAPVGKYEVALGTIAWDEELIEELPVIAAPAFTQAGIASDSALDFTPPSQSTNYASLTSHNPLAPSQIRLLALEHWVLGRLDLHRPSADILLAHRGKSATESAQLTRRISASHVIIRRIGNGAEIVDVSRYGVLLDGRVMKKDRATPLKTGMHIELCASIRGIVCLSVSAILSHAVILQRIDNDEVFYLITPETRPENCLQGLPAGLPMLFHFAGNFWHIDPDTRQETLLGATGAVNKLSHVPHGSRYYNEAYEDLKVRGFGLWRRAVKEITPSETKAQHLRPAAQPSLHKTP